MPLYIIIKYVEAKAKNLLKEEYEAKESNQTYSASWFVSWLAFNFYANVQECHSLYTDPENGLVTIAETLGLKLLAPRKKITIMLIGEANKKWLWYLEAGLARDLVFFVSTTISCFKEIIRLASRPSSTGTLRNMFKEQVDRLQEWER